MKAERSGISLRRDELIALLAFAGEGDMERVYFRATNILEAYASDGVRAVCCEGSEPIGQEIPKGSWLVFTTFLKMVLKNLKSGESTVLTVSGASITEATVFGKDGEELQTVMWTDDACDHQERFTGFDALIYLCMEPQDMGEIRSNRVEIAGEHLAGVGAIARAAQVTGIRVYVGETEKSPVRFVAGGEDVWIAVLMPRADGLDELTPEKQIDFTLEVVK